MQQKFCFNCGKGSTKATSQTHDYPYKQKYDGNQIVLSTRHSHPDAARAWTYYIVWDGETYESFRYGGFCTLKCSCAFANAAVIAGYRREI